MRRLCAEHDQDRARPLRAVSSRLCARSRSLLVFWIAWAGFILGALPCWALDARDAGLLGVARQREIAIRQLERARAAVEAARSAATKSKNELDQFLAAHFEDMRSRAAESLPDPGQSAPPNKQASQINREAEQLNAQINELKARRDELLERLTSEHPEVTDVESRLGDLMLRLSALGPVADDAESLAPGGVVDPGQPDDPRSGQRSMMPKQQRMAADEYQQHLERWQAAEEDLKTALGSEERALARLAAIQLPAVPSSPVPPGPSGSVTSEPSTDAAAPQPHRPAASTASEPREQGSQPLALAALLIALAVAALAAVKLARSSSDVYFENVNDVAAALALPVVGVISAADNAAPSTLSPQSSATRLSRHVTLACELLLAVIAFALVAYGVQNPAALWHLFTHPLESLGSVARFLAE